MQTTAETIFSELASVGGDGHRFFNREWMFKDHTDADLAWDADLALEARMANAKGAQRTRYRKLLRCLRDDVSVAAELCIWLRATHNWMRVNMAQQTLLTDSLPSPGSRVGFFDEDVADPAEQAGTVIAHVPDGDSGELLMLVLMDNGSTAQAKRVIEHEADKPYYYHGWYRL